MVSWTRFSYEKMVGPTVLFSSVAIRLAKTVMCSCALQLWELTDGDYIWLVDRKGILIRESRQLLDGLSLFECGYFTCTSAP